MKKISALFFLSVMMLTALCASELPSDILTKLNGYNVNWTELSTTGSKASMPLGNGEISANVWVGNGGDLMMYIGKSDTWSEGTRLLKVGRLRMSFSPNPFTAGATFSQVLNLHKGLMEISAGATGSKVYLKIWIDANNPVIRIEATGDNSFTMQCKNENMRPKSFTLQTTTEAAAVSFLGVRSSPTKAFESADSILSKTDRLVWFHRNWTSMYPAILVAQNLSGFDSNFPDPYLNRTFGATVKAKDFEKLNDSIIQSPLTKSATLSVYPYTAQTSTVEAWETEMNNSISAVESIDIETARENHYAWWDKFWNRSWIFISGDANASQVTQGYLLQRYLQACDGRGKQPIKFNGGTFTFDYTDGLNGDFRKWGSCIWAQNTRHMYWPMLPAGDFDLMMPWFDQYKKMLGIQTAATKKYFNHAGAYFPETFNFYGLHSPDDWGWSNASGTIPNSQYMRYHFTGGLEIVAMMLEYYDYTKDETFVTNYLVPIADAVVTFFDKHWARTNGIIKYYPANAIEMYWGCTNPTDYLAGLKTIIPRLTALPTSLTTQTQRDAWTGCFNALPPLPLDATGTRVLPAEVYGGSHNSENPECYGIYPFRIYGIGKPNFEIGLNTFNNRVIKTNKNCWSQDVIQEALLGLIVDAKADVISNFSALDGSVKFPAFWKPSHDYLPDLDNGGAAMTALQYMLQQCNGSEIRVLPTWTKAWSVDYKLSAPNNTTVRLKYANGTVNLLDVYPASRAADVIYPDSIFNETIVKTSAYSKIEAEAYNLQSGVKTENCSEGTLDVAYISNGDYCKYNNVDFGENGAATFTARVAGVTAACTIEVRLDSPSGTLIGTCPVTVTSGWQAWANASCSVSGITGVRNLFLVFRGPGTGSVFNLNWFQFTAVSTAAVVEVSGSKNEIDMHPNPVSGLLTINNSENSKVQLYNSLGACVYVQKAKDKTHLIDFSSLSKDVYILKLTNDEGVKTAKIIKK